MKKNLMKRITALFLSLTLVFGMVAATSQKASANGNVEGISTMSWMGEVDGSTKLSAITIPGTHDSSTQYIPLSYVFKCQNVSILEQLMAGYRYLDMRIAIDDTKDGKKIKLIHNIGNCKTTTSWFSDNLMLEDVLEYVYLFLETYPTETVIMCMKAENGKDDVAELQTLLYELIDANPDKWYTKNSIPELDEVRGKIVLATRFEDANNLGEDRTGLHFDWEGQGDKEIQDIPYALSMINETESLWVQDRYKYGVEDKVNAVIESFENCEAGDDTFFLNFSSTAGSGAIGHPKKFAKTINQKIMEYDFKANTSYGVVIVDFGTTALATHIFASNFPEQGVIETVDTVEE